MPERGLQSANNDKISYAESFVTSLSAPQQKALALIPILPALLSIVSSFLLIHLIVRSKFNTPYKRILFAFSVVDVIASINHAISPFLLPAETSNRVWAFGRRQTCTATGALLQFGFAEIWYYGVVSYYFLLIIRFGMTPKMFAQRYEIPFHALSLGFNLTAAIVGAAIGAFNEYELGRGCWVANTGCNPDNGDACESVVDANSAPLGWVFGGIPVMIMLFSSIINNLLIYCKVRSTIVQTATQSGSTELGTIQSEVDGHEQSSRSSNPALIKQRLRQVATQAFMYVFSFLATYIIPVILRVLESMGYRPADEDQFYFLLVLQALFLPLIGFFNLLVYIRPRYLRTRSEYSNRPKLWCLRRALREEASSPSPARFENSGFEISNVGRSTNPSVG